MNGNFLRINDLVTFRLTDQNLIKVKDNFMGHAQQGHGAQQAQGLQIRIAATHSGIITRNNGFYLPDKMKKGASSFTDNYPKPVLLHHEDHNDPIGRIIASQYLDTSGIVQDKFNLKQGLVVTDKFGQEKGTITEQLIQDFVDGKMPFGMQVDTICTLFKDSLLQDTNFDGLGHIQVVGNITDKNAIEKLLDGRYLTGSVGATTDKAICSVCRQDWTDAGQCEHKPGALYDEAKCFIIAGDLVYDEYSFVNVPADRHSKVLQLHYNGIQDNIDVANDYLGRIYEVQLKFPQFDDSVTKEDEGMTKKAAGDTTIVETPPVDIQDSVNGSASGVPESDKTEDPKEVVDNTQLDGSDTQVQDQTKEESIKDFLGRVLEADSLTNEEEQKLYNEMLVDMKSAVKDGELTDEAIQEVELSAERRKKLARSIFCGPGRSFPVPDCAHVVAARRVLHRAKISESTKTSILVAVSRKAKALGCESNKDSTTKVQEALHHGRVMHMVVTALEEAQHFGEDPILGDDEVKMLQSILKRLSFMVGKDNFMNAAVNESLSVSDESEQVLVDEITKGEDTIGILRDELDALRKEYTALYGDMSNLQDNLQESLVDTRKSKESTLKLLITLRDKKTDDDVNFTTLSNTELTSELDRVTKEVDMVKIADKLGDGMSREPTEPVEDPTVIQDENRKSATPEQLAKIQEHHMHLLFSKGQVAAEAFTKEMQVRGFIPRDSEN